MREVKRARARERRERERGEKERIRKRERADFVNFSDRFLIDH